MKQVLIDYVSGVCGGIAVVLVVYTIIINIFA
jgi:phage shock protein PspC (stress-responsive transcriptional regulator)